MTPAINLAKKKKIPHTIHEYQHDASCSSYGLEAAEKMGVEPARVFKTLVVELNTQEMVVGVVPVATTLNMKNIAKAAGGKKAQMAEPQAVERATGYVLGGVSPLGQKKRLRTFVDTTAQALPTMFISAGKRGLEIELVPSDLLQLVGGQFAAIADG
tara:strand:+ start:6658 stop:7128 length:471 start_codon:yes stop_codon:yes gene_type:complete